MAIDQPASKDQWWGRYSPCLCGIRQDSHRCLDADLRCRRGAKLSELFGSSDLRSKHKGMTDGGGSRVVGMAAVRVESEMAVVVGREVRAGME